MSQTPTTSDQKSPPSTPRWVKVFGLIALIILVALALNIAFGGSHGPGRHTPPSGSNGYYMPTTGYSMQQI